ncbi:MAG: hypothetical protein ABIJ56_21190 [Pseudomonadota bacterium]
MARTFTVSKRPWALVVIFAVSLLFVLVFSLIHANSKYVTPTGTIDKFVSALKKGDVDTLQSDPELNFRERALSDIGKRGLEEYNKVSGAFDACLVAGMDKYKAVRQSIMARGEEIFKQLPAEHQRNIKTQSKMTWIYGAGLKSMDKESRQGAEGAAVFMDDEKRDLFILELGRRALEPEAVEDLPTVDALMKKKYSTGRPPNGSAHAKIIEKGREAFDELKKKVLAAGSKEFAQLPKDEQEKLARQSRHDFIVKQGTINAQDQDRPLIPGPDMFAIDADEEKEAIRLCAPLLSKANRELIEDRDYEDFITKKDMYIMQTGRDKYEKFLVALLGECGYEIKKISSYGTDEFDLMRTSQAQVEIKWIECSGVETFLPPVLSLELDEGKWRIIWEKEKKTGDLVAEAPGEKEAAAHAVGAKQGGKSK